MSMLNSVKNCILLPLTLGIISCGASSGAGSGDAGQSVKGSCVYLSGGNHYCAANVTQDQCKNNYTSGSWSSSSCSARGYGLAGPGGEELNPSEVTEIDNFVNTKLRKGMTRTEILIAADKYQNTIKMIDPEAWLFEDYVFIFHNDKLFNWGKQALSANSYHHDFEKVEFDSVVEYNYKITNNNNNTIVITDVLPSCNCTGVSDDFKKILNPGESTNVLIKFNSTGFKGKVQKNVRFVTSNKQHPDMILTFEAIVNSK